MIKVGDIVFKKYTGGIMKAHPKTSSIGLVIKEYIEKGSVGQYYVKFDQFSPKWYYQHDLHKIGGER
jgi:hypothetical protein